MKYRQYLASLEKFGINLGLNNIQSLLTNLNNPQNQVQTIHVAGTNGKGSTAAMLATILKEAGYKVGLYTSPHLLDYCERIKINGQDIPREDFEKGVRRVKKAAEEMGGKRAMSPTMFEVLTALAFWYFAKKKVDYAIIEVGLGGRLDATNVITPLVSVITNVELEHTAVLGNTLAKIACEKAGIIKCGVPVVTAENKPEPLKVIKAVCQRYHCPLSTVVLSSAKLPLGLVGDHQQANAACALAALRLAKIPVTKAAIQRGMWKTKWPGRFQILSKKPLIIVDGAHNPAGVKALQVTMSQLFPGKRFTVIFGCQKSKQYPAMLNLLKSIADNTIITRSSNSLAAEAAKIHQSARKLYSRSSLAAGLADAYSQWDRQTPLLITGSLFLVADTLKHLDGLRLAVVK